MGVVEDPIGSFFTLYSSCMYILNMGSGELSLESRGPCKYDDTENFQ